MAILRRNKANDNLPDEVKQYYAAQQRDRSGVAWIYAFVSLVIVILVGTGLFFGGRWTYRKLKNDSDKPKVSTNNTNKPASPAAPKSSTPPTSASSPPSNSANPSPNSGATPASPARPSTPTATTPSSPSTSSQTPSSPTPSAPTQGSANRLTNTGQASLLVTFLATSTLATLVAYVYQTFKTKNQT